MPNFTASDAKNRFGELLDAAAREPVTIKRNGRDVAVVLSPAEFARLTAAMPGEVSPRVKELHARSMKRFGAVYEALAK